MRIYSLIVLLALPLAIRSCQPQGLPTLIDLSKGRKVLVDSSAVIQRQGGYQGILIIGDNPNSWHGKTMHEIITGIESGGNNDYLWGTTIGSIPKENIVFFNEIGGTVYGKEEGGWHNLGLKLFASGDYESLRLQTRVANLPVLIPFGGINDASRIAKNDILFVIAAGNIHGTDDRRDLWSVQHPFWQGDGIRFYNNALASFKTGKVIAATSAIERRNGDIVPWKEVVQCGDIAEWCFTVLPESYTSVASARLAAMSFYLAQLYPTAEEIVETLNACAIDIGEPGIDREFGRGLANIVCAPVLEKELEAAMRVSSMTAHSPALERVLSSEEKEDCACVSFFSSVTRGFGTTVGHVGVSLADDVTLLAGRGFAPIGVESSLFIETNMFAEISYKRSLFKKRDHRVDCLCASLIATHSRQWGDTSAHISRLGLQYAKQTDRYRAGIYAGYRHATIAVGLPGYKLANTSHYGQCNRIDPMYQPLVFPETYRGETILIICDNREMRFALSVGL